MKTEDRQFTADFYQLSEEAQFYFGSDLSVKVMKGLINQYHCDEDALYRLIFVVVNNNFDFSFIKKHLLDLKVGPTVEKQFAQDFIGRIFLPLATYLKGVDIKKALLSQSGAEENYSSYVSDFYNQIEEENLSNIDVLAEAHDRLVDPLEEKALVLEFFRQDLVEILKAETPEAIKSLNGAVIYLLLNVDIFKTEISNALFENKLILTKNRINLDGKEAVPTIANWLKDFIRINGSEIFNEVVLAQYLGSSSNASRLGQEEKKTVGKLLKLYRNLVFFPESMQDKPLDKWEIIPVDYNEGAENKGAMASRVKAGSKTTPVDDVLSNDRAAKTPEGARVKTPEAEKLSFGESWPKLEEILQKYTPGSLEYKVIKEEIARLKKKK